VEVRRYGARALLLSAGGVAPVDIAAAVLSAAVDGVVDVVPAAETVLVVVGDATRLDAARGAVEGLEVGAGGTTTDAAGSEVLLDVVYDGPDLADVASASGLTADDVVAVHSGASYRCEFCGFAPGFAYLSGLDPRLVLPRRATPRTSVPAGSVAIAGRYTGVYPSASPGGWHLLGHTDAVLWDLAADPPALITPGTTVRFRPTSSTNWVSTVSISRRSTTRSIDGTGDTQIGGLRVVNAGMATSVQDGGRPGYADLAVPASGAVDPARRDLVNRLVGNPAGAAVVETAGGLVVEAEAAVVVADSTSGALRALLPGQTIAVGPAAGQVWAYLAVRGGIEAPVVLGSRSWDSLSRLGPSPPQAGDVLPIGRDPGTPVTVDQAPIRARGPVDAIGVRVGPHADRFATGALDALVSAPWAVTTSSRVGVRLAGAPITRADDGELPSEGLVHGAIQVPPDGQPVVMLADHPTTGGYPVLAVVDDGELGRLAQQPPGSEVRFRPIDRKGR
jgi:KipI family sensor histidine kinase inhibitor